MKQTCCLLVLAGIVSTASAQDPPAAKMAAGLRDTPVVWDEGASPFACSNRGSDSRFAGNHNFDCFIGFMSNPLFNIDPRAVTELWPMAGGTSVSTTRALPSADIWIPPSAGIYIALSERLSLGLNQGGYAIADFDRNDPGVFTDRFGKLRKRSDFGGQREGWLNLGGFVQYTVFQNVECQALATVGMRWEAPMGSQAIFQGNSPARLAPYVTVGKGYGNVHLLATAGFEFPAGSGSDNHFFYGCFHLDRQTFGWLYPLVEVNWIAHTGSVSDDLETRDGGFISLGNFSTTGNLVTLAVGANAVLIRNKLELGAVYTTTISTTRDLGFNGFLAKMVIRF